MKHFYLVLIFFSFLLSCNQYTTLYPNDNLICIYIDNSKIKEFDVSLIYNYIDTIHHDDKILIIDTLNFKIDHNGISENNRKYLQENTYVSMDPIREYDFLGSSYQYPKLYKNIVQVYKGENIRVILKKDENVLESYIIDLDYDYKFDVTTNSKQIYNFQYIINPLSLSRYELDTIQFGGVSLFSFFSDHPKSKIYSNSFISFGGFKSDFFLETPSDTLSYTYSTHNGISIDPGSLGIRKLVLTKID